LEGAQHFALERTKEVIASEDEWRGRAAAAEAAAAAMQLERDAAVEEVRALREVGPLAIDARRTHYKN
jgi:hypothetical protein